MRKLVLVGLALLPACGPAADLETRVSPIAENGMPHDIVARGARWNFGAGSLWTHKGWQYAAYWDDRRQVCVARRELPSGAWAVASLPDYQRSASGDRGKGGVISRGFGDGHEKVAMGISPDGVIHLSFDHHLSTLRYRTSRLPVAEAPEAHAWSADLFGPVQDHLGGKRITSVTYPSFHTDGDHFLLYLRLGGGSGAANSHLFAYRDGKWVVNQERQSQIIDQRWSGGDGTVNAYPFGLVIRGGRCHLSWCWRDTPDAGTCHDLCYAYSDDFGETWRNSAGEVIGKRGESPISADSPGVTVWEIPPGTRYVNGGSMAVQENGRVHVLVRGETGKPAHFSRDPSDGEWARRPSPVVGKLAVAATGAVFAFDEGQVYRMNEDARRAWTCVAAAPPERFEDCKAAIDPRRLALDGWLSVIGQHGKQVRVIDFPLGVAPPR